MFSCCCRTPGAPGRRITSIGTLGLYLLETDRRLSAALTQIAYQHLRIVDKYSVNPPTTYVHLPPLALICDHPKLTYLLSIPIGSFT